MKSGGKQVTFTMQIQFKDGKIRFDVPVIEKYPRHDGWGDAIQWIKYQKIQKQAADGLVPYFNNLVMSYLEKSFSPNETDW